MYDWIVGVLFLVVIFIEMVDLIDLGENGIVIDVVFMVMDNNVFYDVILKNFVVFWINEV